MLSLLSYSKYYLYWEHLKIKGGGEVEENAIWSPLRKMKTLLMTFIDFKNGITLKL